MNSWCGGQFSTVDHPTDAADNWNSSRQTAQHHHTRLVLRRATNLKAFPSPMPWQAQIDSADGQSDASVSTLGLESESNCPMRPETGTRLLECRPKSAHFVIDRVNRMSGSEMFKKIQDNFVIASAQNHLKRRRASAQGHCCIWAHHFQSPSPNCRRSDHGDAKINSSRTVSAARRLGEPHKTLGILGGQRQIV